MYLTKIPEYCSMDFPIRLFSLHGAKLLNIVLFCTILPNVRVVVKKRMLEIKLSHSKQPLLYPIFFLLELAINSLCKKVDSTMYTTTILDFDIIKSSNV